MSVFVGVWQEPDVILIQTPVVIPNLNLGHESHVGRGHVYIQQGASWP